MVYKCGIIYENPAMGITLLGTSELYTGIWPTALKNETE
jgi:hypothetical protein